MQPPEPGNARTVYVVQVDHSKDLSDARRYGELRAVFGRPRRPYDTDMLLRRGREALAAYQPGDYVLMLGDPALCGVALALTAERSSVINVLSWDRNSFRYLPQRWNFEVGPGAGFSADDEYYDFYPAED